MQIIIEQDHPGQDKPTVIAGPDSPGPESRFAGLISGLGTIELPFTPNVKRALVLRLLSNFFVTVQVQDADSNTLATLTHSTGTLILPLSPPAAKVVITNSDPSSANVEAYIN